MKSILFLLIIILSFFNIYAQKNKEIVFDYKKCEDSFIFYLPRQDLEYGKTNELNFGNRESLSIAQWTWSSFPGSSKALLFFDLSSLPKNTKIISAKLSLYVDKVLNDENFSVSKSEELKIQEIISNWNELSVTWNNRPNVSDYNKIIVPDNADLENIDITKFVQDWVKNPKNNYGMMISCAYDDYYRGIYLASSEFADKNLRPKLTVKFQKNSSKAPRNYISGVDGKELNSNCDNNQTLIVYNLDFTELYKEKNVSSNRMAEIINELNSGKYLFQLISEDLEITTFQVLKK